MAKLSDKIKQSSVSDRIRVAILAELENISTATGGTGLATEATLVVVNTNLSTVNTNVQLGNVVLGNLLTTLTSVVRTPSLQRISGIATASIAAGVRSASFFNAGPTDATVAGGTLKPGESISFDAGGQGDTLGAIAYVTIATGDLVITTIT